MTTPLLARLMTIPLLARLGNRPGASAASAGPRGERPRLRVGYFVSPSRDFAGIERVVHEIASGLASEWSAELEVHVIYSSPYAEDVLTDTPYVKHVLDVDRLLQLSRPARECIKGLQLDVLICPQVEASVMLWLATRGLDIGAFLPHFHGNPMVEEEQGTLRTRLAYFLFRHWVSRRVPRVLAVSPSLARFLSEGLTPKTPVTFVKNPVRQLQLRPASRSGSDRLELVCVARLSHQKGQDILLRALALARPELPAVRLTLVGGGPEQQNLQSLAQELGIADLVRFTGYTSDPGSFLTSADWFVLASRWEGFGVAIIEALQCGLPVLAASCDFGPADIVTDAALGLLVPPSSPEGLAEGLKAAAMTSYDDSDVVRRQQVAAEYSRENVLRSHYEVLVSVAAAAS